MTLALDKQGLEVELHRVMDGVILSLLSAIASTNDNAHDNTHAAGAPRKLGCQVAIHGEFEGHVTVLATLGLASHFAVCMFGDDLTAAPTQADAQDALREVANIVAGNLKPLFGGQNTLGLPENMAADASARADVKGQLAQAALEHVSGTLEVRVYAAL
jgi:Chemotaxis phosphatase CheX